MKKRGLNKVKDNRKWTEKILNVREIGNEPPFNKDGFWKQRQSPEIKVIEEEK